MPSSELSSLLARHRWTAHNIELAPGIETLPGAPRFLEASPHLRAILRTLDLAFPAGLTGIRVADLGCLEGGFSLGVAMRGAEVVGVEAREENVAKCNVLQQHFGLPNLRFVQDDVKEFTVERYGRFDALLALGILYHLDRPAEWVAQIAGTGARALLLETHYAPESDDALPSLRPAIRKLGPLESVEAGGMRVEGRWFHEYDTDAERDGMPWASWSNSSSFWLTRRSIFASLQAAGFDLLYEQVDHWLDRWDVIRREYPRSLFVGIRTGAGGP